MHRCHPNSGNPDLKPGQRFFSTSRGLAIWAWGYIMDLLSVWAQLILIKLYIFGLIKMCAVGLLRPKVAHCRSTRTPFAEMQLHAHLHSSSSGKCWDVCISIPTRHIGAKCFVTAKDGMHFWFCFQKLAFDRIIGPTIFKLKMCHFLLNTRPAGGKILLPSRISSTA